jgi:hypothetical protein
MLRASIPILALTSLWGGVDAHRPRLLLSFPDSCNTPDGMALDTAGNLYLSCPNFNDQNYPGIVMKIDPQNRPSIFFAAPVHPETGRGAPMGIEFGPDGNIYYADNQYFTDQNCKSRLMRIVMKEGVPVRGEVVVEGLKLANAVRWKGDTVFVSDTFFDLPDEPGASGIYRFRLSEFDKQPVKVLPLAKDPHLIARFQTVPNHRKDLAGADGMAIDHEGRLLTGNFGDGVLSRLTFAADGSVAKQETISRKLTCVDGMVYDKRSGNIYIADSEKNAIQVLAPDGTVSTLWENDDADGSDGLLDQPCEPIVRGDELIVANFDMTFPGLKNRGYDKFHTLSAIRLK